VGAAAYAIGLFLLSRANSFDEFFIIYILFGVSSAASTILPSSVVIANWFSERRGLAMSVAFTAISLGGAVMTIVTNYAVRLGGWRLGCVALATPVAIVAIPMILAVVRTRPPAVQTVPAEPASGTADDPPATALEVPGLDMRNAFRTRSLWMLALSFLLANCIGAGVGLHFIAYLIGIGYSATFAAEMASLTLVFVALGSLLAGPLADRVGARKSLAAVYGGWSVAMLCLLSANHGPVLIVYVMVGGFVLGAPWVLGTLAVVESLGIKRLGSVLGFLGIFATAGMATGPILAGRIFDVTRSYHAAFWIFVGMSIVCAAAMMACRELEQEQARLAAPAAAA